MDPNTTKRGNYESGSDYVLEYGELRFTFNERDFTERVEQAAIKLGFVRGLPRVEEREDLVNLAVNGEVIEPASDLGQPHQLLLGRPGRPLRPLARPLAAPARVPGRLAGPAREGGRARGGVRRLTQNFGYAQPDRDWELVELSPEPSWANVAYRGRLARAGRASVPDAGPAAPLSSTMRVVATRRGSGDWPVMATTVSEPPSSRAALRRRRAGRPTGAASRGSRWPRPRRGPLDRALGALDGHLRDLSLLLHGAVEGASRDRHARRRAATR